MNIIKKAKENNLENQVQFKLADYRNLKEKFFVCLLVNG